MWSKCSKECSKNKLRYKRKKKHFFYNCNALRKLLNMIPVSVNIIENHLSQLRLSHTINFLLTNQYPWKK